MVLSHPVVRTSGESQGIVDVIHQTSLDSHMREIMGSIYPFHQGHNSCKAFIHSCTTHIRRDCRRRTDRGRKSQWVGLGFFWANISDGLGHITLMNGWLKLHFWNLNWITKTDSSSSSMQGGGGCKVFYSMCRRKRWVYK